jgi:hypothetical protein
VVKHDLGSKLKARLGEWQAYGELQGAPFAADSQLESPLESGPLAPLAEPARALVEVEQFAETSAVEPGDAGPATVPVEDLRAALEHERVQSRRLSEMVEREQILHAVTLRSQVDRGRQSEARDGSGNGIATRRTRQRYVAPVPVPLAGSTGGSRRMAAMWVFVLLLVAAGCTCLALSFMR